FFTNASTLGQALWQGGWRLDALDRLSASPETPLSAPLTVTVSHPAGIQVTANGKVQSLRTNAATVGQALSQAGIRLVGLDYSLPDQAAPLPLDGRIRVVRVRESVTLQQKTIPFETTTQADPQTELDQRSVIQPGQVGLLVTRLRVRYEEGKEVSRQTDAEWKARDPRKRILGYGTQIVLHTTTVDGVTIQYYRAVTVYATSYSPCDSGTCNYKTASGATVAKGVIGVSPAWYNLLRGQQVYVPGYGSGVIADYGGVSGHWIDLGYSDSEFVGWHKNVTIYFLAPAPASVPWALP
ncbi:MAG TPA: ubiquitin-like domain-containing protein, partial [Anaerolineaceae bacterium]